MMCVALKNSDPVDKTIYSLSFVLDSKTNPTIDLWLIKILHIN